jgi:hypothetical protein
MIAQQSPFAIGRRCQPAPLCGGSLTATPSFPLLPSVENSGAPPKIKYPNTPQFFHSKHFKVFQRHSKQFKGFFDASFFIFMRHHQNLVQRTGACRAVTPRRRVAVCKDWPSARTILQNEPIWQNP